MMKREHMEKLLQNVNKVFWLLILALLFIFSQERSEIQLTEKIDQIRPYTIGEEFDFITWTVKAVWEKFNAASMNWPDILPQESFSEMVSLYEKNEGNIDECEYWIDQHYIDPDGIVNDYYLKNFQNQREDFIYIRSMLEPVYESIMAEYVRNVLVENNLTLGNQVFPPVFFRDADLPYALIVSPRDHIEQIINLSLLPDLSLEQMIDLEEKIESNMDVSALVVPVGGIGTYPTMIMRTTNFNYTVEVIQHEWTHNYLTLRPLGLNYETTPELRTINETTASIAGKELGNDLLAMYYPHMLPEPAPEPSDTQVENDEPVDIQPSPIEEPVFDFRAEMHKTRVTVDGLLADGKIEAAESYMEERRLVFVENGYQIRKLNQAYYAFYGAYADQPGGAAGNDPVGEAVRNFRAQSSSLEEFLNAIASVTSFDQLESMLE